MAGSAAALSAAATLRAEPPASVTAFPENGPRFKKGVKLSMLAGDGSHTEKFETAKQAGFDGVDVDRKTCDLEALRAAHEATGLPIHRVVNGASWADRFSSADSAVRGRAV
ncbi:MAG: hypothetical protein AAF907_16960, partial [Planctomycetota bacterium]